MNRVITALAIVAAEVTRRFGGTQTMRPPRDLGGYIRSAVTGLMPLAMCSATVAAAPSQSLGLHTALEGRVGLVDDASRWALNGDNSLYDLSATIRPLWSAQHDDWKLSAELEVTSVVGDTIERSGLPAFSSSGFNRDLFDLTSVWSSGDRHRTTARLDRLSVAWTRPWGTVTAGRHAVTWGGGLVFNPFDLFNPFAPDDVIRDFKLGADMVHVDLPLTDGGLQLLAVGRRDLLTGEAASSASSFAALWQKNIGTVEFALMAASHYDEPAAGASVAGLLGAAAWRVDGTWVRVRPPGFSTTEDYFAAVANLQYSWVWGGKNVLGFLEYHHDGLGHTDYLAALADPFLLTQIGRRNVFLLGRDYAAASLQVELHPLVHAFVSVIVNVHDPSAYLQPRVTWSATDNMQVLAGVDLPVGPRGTEFGGFDPGDGLGTTRAPTSFYVRATWDW